MNWERVSDAVIRDLAETGEPVVIAQYAGFCIRRQMARWSEKKQTWFWGQDDIEWSPEFVLRLDSLPAHNAQETRTPKEPVVNTGLTATDESKQ